jgi:hypothetical protein
MFFWLNQSFHRSHRHTILTLSAVRVDGEALKADLETMLVQNPLGRGYICAVCGKHCGDRSGARNHVEALHLPSPSGYNCEVCGRFLRTRNALNCHMYRNHSAGNKKASAGSSDGERGSGRALAREEGDPRSAAKLLLFPPEELTPYSP